MLQLCEGMRGEMVGGLAGLERDAVGVCLGVDVEGREVSAGDRFERDQKGVGPDSDAHGLGEFAVVDVSYKGFDLHA